jgi:hypothetical protein
VIAPHRGAPKASKNHALQTLIEKGNVKIHQKANSALGQLQVSQKLRMTIYSCLCLAGFFNGASLDYQHSQNMPLDLDTSADQAETAKHHPPPISPERFLWTRFSVAPKPV